MALVPLSPKKSSPRRKNVERQGPTPLAERWFGWADSEGVWLSIAIAAGFFAASAGILMFRPAVAAYRPGQYAASDVLARVDFSHTDPQAIVAARTRARLNAPRVYKSTGDAWARLETDLLTLPDRVSGVRADQLTDPAARATFDNATLAQLQAIAAVSPRPSWNLAVRDFIDAVRAIHPVILPDEERVADRGRLVKVEGSDPVRVDEGVYSPERADALVERLNPIAAEEFEDALYPQLVRYAVARVGVTHALDREKTAAEQNAAANAVPAEAGRAQVKANMPVIEAGDVDEADFKLLRAENAAFRAAIGGNWKERAGLAAAALLLTVGLGAYLAEYQPKVVRNHARAAGIAALLLVALALAQAAAVTGTRLYLFAVLPTVMVGMILAIAYDRRTATGIGAVQAVFVTLAAGEGLGFLLVLTVGVATAASLLDEVRTRSKLVEVGGLTALAMAAAAVAAGLMRLDPTAYVVLNALYAAAAALGAGIVVLAVLPFVEKVFRITTSMTLLELADVSHPLLRKLAMEAPGTYNHSLQVATLAEEAAEAIGADALLCRVAAYFHDVGKVNKAEYFVENQLGGASRHLNLTPSVSLLIIIGHVKDGVEMARDWNLPRKIIPFIQGHHGTTRVEYFYHMARTAEDRRRLENQASGEVSEAQYRYPGPKPRTREVAILMLADACESACRTLQEPNASRIESLVGELSMKRLTDGQFDDCDLTMRDLARVERSIVKTLIGVYHGRIAYPSDKTDRGERPERPADKVASDKVASDKVASDKAAAEDVIDKPDRVASPTLVPAEVPAARSA